MPKKRVFLLKDERYPGVVFGTLTVQDTGVHEKNSYEIDVKPVEGIMLPVVYAGMLNKYGTLHLKGAQAREWIEHRPTPPNRQNISELLDLMHEKKYDYWKVVQFQHCRCIRDYLYMEEVL